MAFYKEANEIIDGTLSEYIFPNQDLCKLLYYYSDTVDYKYNPLKEDDIEDTSSLLMTHIFPVPKNPDDVVDQKCYLNITIEDGSKIEGGKMKQLYLWFDVICHLDAWIISNGTNKIILRPLLIAGEIDKMFNYMPTDLPIFNKPIAIPTKLIKYSNKYFGYRLGYLLQVNGNISCC